jgi:4-nitrophenyl phosphatase
MTSKPAIAALILDMDGVLWRGMQPIGDLPAAFNRIEQLGLSVVLATNNATMSLEQYLEKLCGFGVSLAPWQIVNSSQTVAHHLQQLHPEGGPVFIVGESGMVLELAKEGFYPSTGESPLAVTVGLDRELNYEKLSLACSYIRSGVPFIGSNPDPTYPSPQGLIPGAGAVLAFIEAASGVPPTIVGKPSPEMYRLAMERMQITPEKTLVVGDRLTTDIAGAQAIGCLAALVLSGVTTQDAALQWQPPLDWIATDLTALLEKL